MIPWDLLSCLPDSGRTCELEKHIPFFLFGAIGHHNQVLLEHSDQGLVDIEYKESNTYKSDDLIKELEKQLKYTCASIFP